MNTPIIQVAAGVVVNPQGKILIAKRPDHKHQGGLWEFPGGKIEIAETTAQALARELQEEVGIEIQESEPLIEIRHDYRDKSVHLKVLRITQFTGEAHGREGQSIAWVEPGALKSYQFPAANKPIIAAARLPRTIMITGPFETEKEFLYRLERGLEKRPGMVQFRAHRLNGEEYVALASRAHELCQKAGIPMLANCSIETFKKIQCEGLHLTSQRLAVITERVVLDHVWLSAACHDQIAVQQAVRVGADFALFSPINATKTHPGAAPIGWDQFSQEASSATLPLYALGGVSAGDINLALTKGAQGIAAIGEFWC